MTRKTIEVPGTRYGRLTILAETDPPSRPTRWVCLCDCGKVKSYVGRELRDRNGTRSCGCVINRDASASFLERFWSRVDKDGPTLIAELGQCWTWKGARHVYDGYGLASFKKRPVHAHRVAWFIANGVWPHPFALHKCDGGRTVGCVRIDHLYEGDHAQNMRDMVERKRNPGRRGEKNHNAKLTAEQVAQIKVYLEAGERTQLQIAAQFGVNGRTVSNIHNRKTWRHL